MGHGTDRERSRRTSAFGPTTTIEAAVRLAGHLIPGHGDLLTRGLIALIGLHSLLVGLLMLFAPRFMLGAFGFPADVPVFFPSQSGIFLTILGVCYLLALTEPAFVKVILMSKAFAVLFLVAHVTLLSAPPIIWGAAFGDGGMLVALYVVLHRDRLRRLVKRDRSPEPLERI